MLISVEETVTVITHVHVPRHLPQYQNPCARASYLKLVSPLPAQGLQGKAQVVCFCQRTKIKIILGINTGRNVDVKL